MCNFQPNFEIYKVKTKLRVYLRPPTGVQLEFSQDECKILCETPNYPIQREKWHLFKGCITEQEAKYVNTDRAQI